MTIDLQTLKDKVAALQTDRKQRWELTCRSIEKALQAADARGDARARARVKEMARKADEAVTVLLNDPGVGLPDWDNIQ